MPRKTSRKVDAEAAGKQYAEIQIQSDYFGDWVRDQLAEAAQMPPSDVLPLEDKHDAGIIAKKMLQQLEWDTKKGLGDREIKDLIGADVTPKAHDAFYKGFHEACVAYRGILADELLTIKGEMGGGGRVEARRGRASKPLRYSDEQVRAMLKDNPIYFREQLLVAAKERGWDRPSIVPMHEVWAFLETKVNGGGVGEARTVSAKSRYGNPHPKYKPGKIYKHLKVDRVVPSHNAHRVEFNDGFSVQVHGGSGRDDILYAMRPYDTRLEQRAPGPESRRDYQYAALKAVLDGKPADFVVDHDGDVQARLTAVAREAHRPKA